MNMSGPNSGIARFLTKICDLIFLNVVFILTSCTVVCLGAAVTALYMTAMELYRERDCTPFGISFGICGKSLPPQHQRRYCCWRT